MKKCVQAHDRCNGSFPCPLCEEVFIGGVTLADEIRCISNFDDKTVLRDFVCDHLEEICYLLRLAGENLEA